MEREADPDDADGVHPASGLHAAYLANRPALLRFLKARGAGDAAEDILQDLWLRLAKVRTGPIASPMSYLFRAADMAMIDRHRSRVQADRRDAQWSESQPEPAPASPERNVAAAQEVAGLMAAIENLGPRAATIFRRHRIEGAPQREIASEMGISISTVESDLRIAYRAILEWRERRDKV